MNTEHDYSPMCTDCGERDCATPDECKAEQPVGWMFHTGKGFAVKCAGCARSGLPAWAPTTKATMAARGFTPIYFVNIFPYRQSCYDCTLTLVEGQTPHWCELMTGE